MPSTCTGCPEGFYSPIPWRLQDTQTGQSLEQYGLTSELVLLQAGGWTPPEVPSNPELPYNPMKNIQRSQISYRLAKHRISWPSAIARAACSELFTHLGKITPKSHQPSFPVSAAAFLLYSLFLHGHACSLQVARATPGMADGSTKDLTAHSCMQGKYRAAGENLPKTDHNRTLPELIWQHLFPFVCLVSFVFPPHSTVIHLLQEIMNCTRFFL